MNIKETRTMDSALQRKMRMPGAVRQEPSLFRSVFTDSTFPTLNFAYPAMNSDTHQQEPSTSESGWTTYLDQPGDRFLAAKKEEQEQECTLSEDCLDDPSMASDASSGPEQRDVVRRKRTIKSAPKNCIRIEDDLEDTCQSNLSCESVSDDPDSRHAKRMRVSSLVSYRIASSQIGDGHSDENQVEIQEICSLQSYKSPVDTRLELLQKLIPHSRELDEEQVLEVAIDYVRSLEEKIKMFEAAVDQGLRMWGEDSAAESNTTTETCLSASSTGLHSKGLCLFPLSMVAST